jgi:hypothetical protein
MGPAEAWAGFAKTRIKKGKDGKQGEKGKDGKQGEKGKDGKQGEKGKDGKQGEKGKDGKDGERGKDGRDGKDASPADNALSQTLELIKENNRHQEALNKHHQETFQKVLQPSYSAKSGVVPPPMHFGNLISTGLNNSITEELKTLFGLKDYISEANYAAKERKILGL